MIRYYVIGFLDHDAVKQHQFVTRKSIDKTVVQGLVDEMGQILPNGNISVDGQIFLSHDDCLTFPVPVLRPKAVDFIVRLTQETGCDIADIELGYIITPEVFRELCELLADPRNQAPPLFR